MMKVDDAAVARVVSDHGNASINRRAMAFAGAAGAKILR
jgi:hypothetical protein